MNAIDLKYAGLLSSRLDLFKVKQHNPYRANFRCPICGDSQKSKLKARGWILEKENSAIVYCHNCQASLSMRNFLKFLDHNLYNDYVVDSLIDKKAVSTPRIKPLDKLKKKNPIYTKKGSPLLSIKKVSALKHDHRVKKYLASRRIPSEQQYRMYYAQKFNEWVNSIIPNKLPNLERDCPRLVFPFIDERGVVFGFNARALGDDSLRYITIMIDEDRNKIFGLDQVDFSRKYYVVEGPIDSLFIPNSVAMAGADGNANGLQNPENAVFVFDNEPRNKEIVNRMSKCIERGLNVCIWPEKLEEKDINDAILAGMSKSEILETINLNTYRELEAKLQLSFWKKC